MKKVTDESLLAAEINALPERVRKFVHDLETRADPAGDVREAHVQRENATALLKRVEELEAEVERLEERIRHLEDSDENM